MRKHILSFALLLWIGGLILFPADGFHKPRLYIKFKGVGTLAKGGNFGDFIDRSEIYLADLNSGSDLHNIAFSKTPFFRGFGGEIGIEVEKYAVGISFEYIEKNFHIDYQYADDDSSYTEMYTRDHTFSAIPIFLFIHYKLINTRFLSAFATIGEGVYLGKYIDERAVNFEGYHISYLNSRIVSKKNRLGFHIGATIDFKISSNFALSVEAAYRRTSFKELVGKSFYEDDNETDEEEGDLYYWINNRTDVSQFELGEPEGKIFWEGEPAVLNLNGFMFSIGLKITLGKKGQKTEEKPPIRD